MVISLDSNLGNPGSIPLGSFHFFKYNKRHLSGKFEIVSQPEPGPTKMTKSWYDNSTLSITSNSGDRTREGTAGYSNIFY